MLMKERALGEKPSSSEVEPKKNLKESPWRGANDTSVGRRDTQTLWYNMGTHEQMLLMDQRNDFTQVGLVRQ